MKQVLAWMLIAVLLLSVALPVTADPSDEPSDDTKVLVFDETIFFQEPKMIASCMCSIGLHIQHLAINNVDFFAGERMRDGVDNSCFVSGPGCPYVVFLDGVQNLVKDLFKAWEGDTIDVFVPDTVTEIDEDCFVMNSRITIHFTKNNAVALAYAQNRGMAFEVMGGERLPGDVDFDKNVDMKDVLSLRKAIANFPAAYEIYSTDLNADDSTDMKDVLILRKQIAKVEK